MIAWWAVILLSFQARDRRDRSAALAAGASAGIFVDDGGQDRGRLIVLSLR